MQHVRVHKDVYIHVGGAAAATISPPIIGEAAARSCVYYRVYTAHVHVDHTDCRDGGIVVEPIWQLHTLIHCYELLAIASYIARAVR